MLDAIDIAGLDITADSLLTQRDLANYLVLLSAGRQTHLRVISGLALPFTQIFLPNPRSNRAETDLCKGTAVLNIPAT